MSNQVSVRKIYRFDVRNETVEISALSYKDAIANLQKYYGYTLSYSDFKLKDLFDPRIGSWLATDKPIDF